MNLQIQISPTTDPSHLRSRRERLENAEEINVPTGMEISSSPFGKSIGMVIALSTAMIKLII